MFYYKLFRYVGKIREYDIYEYYSKSQFRKILNNRMFNTPSAQLMLKNMSFYVLGNRYGYLSFSASIILSLLWLLSWNLQSSLFTYKAYTK